MISTLNTGSRHCILSLTFDILIFSSSGRAALDQDLDSILGGNDGKFSSSFFSFFIFT